MLDQIIIEFDKGLRTLFGKPYSVRTHPDTNIAEGVLDEQQKKHSAALMRVNHSGEVCAQALYQGQALTARDIKVKQHLQKAAQEETEHLAWTAQRVSELGGHLSVLNGFWFAGSFVMGTVAGLLGNKWNMGFLAETERQVGSHLQSHLDQLPLTDEKSRAIVTQMYNDELGHANMATALGALALPQPIQMAMRLNGHLMTTASYRI
jgi:ubiquinone biosynthesis monooxygenase Coq7